MSFDMQAEGLNGVNRTTAIVAGSSWGLDATVLQCSGTALDQATVLSVNGMSGQGNLLGVGVIGFGGRSGSAGVAGVAGSVAAPASFNPGQGQNVGVLGLGVSPTGGGAIGVLGESDTAAGVSGTGSPGVAGFGASGDADGVQGKASGTFSGVAGFGDPNNSLSTGVFGLGGAPGSPGIRGVGAGGSSTSRPQANNPVGVYGQGGSGNADGVQGHGSGTFSGVAGFGDPKGANSPGVRGIGGGGPTTPGPASATGVYGQGGAGDANGVEGRGSGQFAGVAGFGDDTNDPNNGIGVFAVGGAPAPNSSTHGGPGVYAIGNGGPAFGPATKVTQPVGVFAVGGGDHAPGIWGVGAGGPAFSAVNPITTAPGVLGVGGIQDDGPGVMGQGGGALGDGVQGFSNSGNGVLGDSANGVGVRAVSTSSTALVAIGSTGLIATSTVHTNLAGEFNGNVLVNGNFTVQGGHKSAAVAFPDGSHRLLYCTESPESWFEDFGFRSFSSGQVHVALDSDFTAIVNNAAYHVFITEYDGHNALYVTQRTSSGFVVKAKDPSASGTFSYRVVAKRGDIPTARFEKIDLPGGLSYLPAHPDDGASTRNFTAAGIQRILRPTRSQKSRAMTPP